MVVCCGPSKLYRRFIVVEGLYQYHGDICPLARLVALKTEYRYRLLLDDSAATGVLGATGRGTAEHFGIAVADIDIMCGVLDHTFAAVGGWCVGKEQAVVDHQVFVWTDSAFLCFCVFWGSSAHLSSVMCDVVCAVQRLSGAGYCFSASSPPFCSAAALASFALIDRSASQLIPALHARTRRMHHALRSQLAQSGLTLNGAPLNAAAPAPAAASAASAAGAPAAEVDAKAGHEVYSPIIHLRLARPLDPTRVLDRRLFNAVSQTVCNPFRAPFLSSPFVSLFAGADLCDVWRGVVWCGVL